MTRPKRDKYKDYVRYAENCLNMVAATTDQEARSIQREMASQPNLAWDQESAPPIVYHRLRRSECSRT
jgi:hypothetical protein